MGRDPDAARPQAVDSILFACLDQPEPEQEAAVAAACAQRPEQAELLRRCWERIRNLRPPAVGMPTQIAGHRILRRLGGGGMGVVYLAEQTHLHRKVALKLIRSDLVDSAAARERFQREAQAASKVEHPGLCPVFEVGEACGVPFLVMPFLEGDTLVSRIAELAAARANQGGPTTVHRDLLAVIAGVARAAHHAHEHGLVHRDIKPGNVMLLTDGRPVLLDFGLARDTTSGDATLTKSGERVGTPAYMAPEQLRGDRAVDRRADIYALGLLLYEVATLERAFTSDDLLALREQIASGVRPARLRGKVPYDLASIVLKAADPEPARRYATAAAFADDVDRFLRLEPVSARRLSRLGHALRWARRYPLVAGLLVALLLALAFAGSALQDSWREQRRFRSLALLAESRAAERTDATRALAKALEADELEPTPRSLVQLNRAVAAQRELHRWDVGEWLRWVGLSADGRSILAVTQQGSRHVFDRTTYAVSERLPPPEPDLAITFVVTSAARDVVVFGGTGNQAHAWRPATGECLPLAPAHGARVLSATVAADGTIFTGDAKGHIARWRADGTLAAPFPWLETGGAALELITCGSRLVVGGERGLVLASMVDAERREATRVETGDPATLLSAADEVGRVFAARLGTQGMVDAEGGRQTLPGGVFRWFGGHMDRSGRRLATSHRGFVRIYDLAAVRHGLEGVAGATYRDASVGSGSVVLVRYSDDGSRLFAMTEDHVLQVFDGAGEVLLSLPGLFKTVRAVDYDAAAQQMVTGDDAGSVRLWDVRVCRSMPPEYRQPGGSYNGLATGTADPLIARRDNGRLTAFPVDGSAPWEIAVGNAIFQDARVSADGKALALATRDGTASVWDLATRAKTWAVAGDRVAQPVGVDFLPGGRLLVVHGSSDPARSCEVRIWRVGASDQTPEAQLPCPKEWGKLNHGAATRDGRHVVLGSYAKQAWVLPLDVDASPPRFGTPRRIDVGQAVIQLDVAPQGDRFAAACADNCARVYALDGRLLMHLVGHGKRVERVHFSPSGGWIATASLDGTARIWDAASGESWMEVEVGDPSPVWDAVFRPDEQVLYTVSVDGRVRGWLLDRAMLRALPRAGVAR